MSYEKALVHCRKIRKATETDEKLDELSKAIEALALANKHALDAFGTFALLHETPDSEKLS